MSNNKMKFASLTAGLLARKGEAEPSATPFADQLLTRVGAPAPDLRPMIQNTPPKAQTSLFGSPVFGRRAPHEADHFHQEQHEYPAPAPMPAQVPALVHVIDEEPHDAHQGAHCASCPGPSAEDAHKTYHVNLRMKRMRFIRLKLTSALLRKPVQEIVSEALDAWFDTVPSDVLGDCACLHSRAE